MGEQDLPLQGWCRKRRGEGGGVRRGGGSNTIRKDNVHVILFAQYVVMTTTPSAVDVSMVTGGCL